MPDGWTRNRNRGREESESAMFINREFFRARPPSHPFRSFFSGHEDSRSFPRVKSSCHLNASFSCGFFARSLVCTLHLLPCLHPFRSSRGCMCVEQGFFGVDSWTCSFLLSHSVRFALSVRFSHVMGFVRQHVPIHWKMRSFATRERIPSFAFRGLRFFFPRYCVWLVSTLGSRFCTVRAACATARVALLLHVLVVPPQKDAGSCTCARVRATKRRLQASGCPMPPFWDPTLRVTPPTLLRVPPPDLIKGGMCDPWGKSMLAEVVTVRPTPPPQRMGWWTRAPHHKARRP